MGLRPRVFALLLLFTFLLGLQTAGAEGQKVLIAVSEEAGAEYVTEMFEDAGFVVVDAGVIQDRLRRKALTLDSLYDRRDVAEEIAKDLYARGVADFIIVGEKDWKERKKSGRDDYGNRTIKMTLKYMALNGPNGQLLGRVKGRGTGVSTNLDRAKEKALDYAWREVEDEYWAEEKIARALAREGSREQELKVAVIDLSEEGYERVGPRLDNLLRSLGKVTILERNYDARSSQLIVKIRYPGRAPKLENELLEALRGGGTTSEFTVVRTRGDLVALRYESPYTDIRVVIHDLAPKKYLEHGQDIYDILKSLSRVEEVEKTYDDATKVLTFKTKYKGRPTGLDDQFWALATNLPGLRNLVLAGIGKTVIEYRLLNDEVKMHVQVLNVKAEDLRVRGKAITDILTAIKGVRDLERTYDETTNILNYTLIYRGRPYQLDEAFWKQAKGHDGLAGITVMSGQPHQLVYALPEDQPQRILLRVTNMPPEIYRKAGNKFYKGVADLPGVANLRRDYDQNLGVLELTLDYHGTPVDLDRAVWSQIVQEGDETLKNLVPGTTVDNVVSYMFMSEQPDSIVCNVRVTDLAPVNYRVDGRALIEVIKGLEGVSEVVPNYDADKHLLTVKLRYKGGKVHKFEDALWKVLETREFARAFSAELRTGNTVRLQFIVKKGEEARVIVRVLGLTPGEEATQGRLFFDILKGIEGVKNVQRSYDEQTNTLQFSLWYKGEPYDLQGYLQKPVSEHEELSEIEPGGLEGNVITFRTPRARETLANSGNPIAENPAQPPTDKQLLTVPALVEKVDPSVVFITCEWKGMKWLGSGVIVSSRGYILTNDHVITATNQAGQRIPHSQSTVRVQTIEDGRWYTARVIKSDPELDAALIKIPGDSFPHSDLGNSNRLKVGDKLVVIGNPHGLSHSVSTGVVSGFDRGKGRLQTDAAINPGNSGGPAYDMYGEVVGLVVARGVQVVRNGNRTVQIPSPGIGYVIPINHLNNLIDLMSGQGR